MGQSVLHDEGDGFPVDEMGPAVNRGVHPTLAVRRGQNTEPFLFLEIIVKIHIDGSPFRQFPPRAGRVAS